MEKLQCSGTSAKADRLVTTTTTVPDGSIQRLRVSTVGSLPAPGSDKLPKYLPCSSDARVERVLASALEMFGLLEYDISMDSSVIDSLNSLVAAGHLETVAKQFCAWPMALLLGNELPKQPLKDLNYEYFLGRNVRRIIRSRCHPNVMRTGTKNKRRESLYMAQTLLQWKRAFLEVPESFVEKELEKHRETVGASRSRPPPKIEGGTGFDVDKRIERAIDQIVCEIFPRRRSSLRSPLPSLNASMLSSRDGGGAFNEVYEIPSCPREPRRTQPISDDWIRDLYRYASRLLALPELVQVFEKSGEVLWVHGFTAQPRHVDLTCRPGDRCSARVCAVLEPCKVRTVSCGDADKYFLSKSWNRLVYRYLPQHPTFRLVGRPCSPLDFKDFTGRYLLSGDYKGATDTIFSEWSEYALQQVNTRLGIPFEYQPLLQQCLTRHRLHYTDGSEVDQVEGQLMGSPISFPILCILNAAINYVYLNPALDRKISCIPLLINGDDVAASSDRDFSDWESYANRVGFVKSVGKNYVHESVMCINSEFYERQESKWVDWFGQRRTDYTFERLPLLSMGLMWGNGRVVGGKSSSEERIRGKTVSGYTRVPSYASACGYLVRMDMGHIGADRLIDRFISHNLEGLKGTKRNWFVPKCLGGVGLPLTERTAKCVTELSRKIAAYIYTRPTAEGDMGQLLTEMEGKMFVDQHAKAVRRVADFLGLIPAWSSSVDDAVDPEDLLSIRLFSGFGNNVMENEGKDDNGKWEKFAAKAACTGLKPMSFIKLWAVSRTPMRVSYHRMRVENPGVWQDEVPPWAEQMDVVANQA